MTIAYLLRLIEEKIANPAMMLGVVLAWPLLGGSQAWGEPTNRYVSLQGGHLSPYDSWERAGTNLKTVVDYANALNEGDTVWVSNGTHAVSATVTILNTIVRGFDPDRTAVVIDGGGTYRCFILNHPNAMLDRLTVSNGFVGAQGTAPNRGGAGITVQGGGLVTNCVVRDCQYTVPTANVANYGGGIGLITGRVANCLVTNNLIQCGINGFGGGVGIFADGSGTVYKCDIVGNTADGGGGIGSGVAPLTQVTHCRIVGNSAGGSFGGGGVFARTALYRGCTISDNATAGNGGGVRTEASGEPMRFEDCVISANAATNYGGGFYGPTGSSRLDLIRCAIASNICYGNDSTGPGGGGGVAITSKPILVSNCVVQANEAPNGRGGGVAVDRFAANDGKTARFVNSLVADNIASNGGGLYFNAYLQPYSNRFWVVNCTIAGNEASELGVGGGIYLYRAYPVLMNTIAYGNTSGGTSSNLYTGGSSHFNNTTNCLLAPTNTAMTGCIDSNPGFANAGNYRLSERSAAINAGWKEDWMDGSADLDNHARVFNGKVDIGAYEYRAWSGSLIMIR